MWYWYCFLQNPPAGPDYLDPRQSSRTFDLSHHKLLNPASPPTLASFRKVFRSSLPRPRSRMSCISRSWSQATVEVGCKERVQVVEVPGRLWVEFFVKDGWIDPSANDTFCVRHCTCYMFHENFSNFKEDTAPLKQNVEHQKKNKTSYESYEFSKHMSYLNK